MRGAHDPMGSVSLILSWLQGCRITVVCVLSSPGVSCRALQQYYSLGPSETARGGGDGTYDGLGNGLVSVGYVVDLTVVGYIAGWLRTHKVPQVGDT